ncbi:hypothetical protein F441_00663 [Phytophthora nicotianae CJ01A1]|uniref:Uncharacterized protein n=7 Tax=Phytophthora nicotianae TaxID=4792 RepID=W2RFA0_PHYN3|nr:hypothetical protein PPTG_00562 [Phytophthora nicotianae INRA-310]ETI56965.1 hypothetical protein F443_00673 [Phytophthora nicotianae P1569]ETL50078.1 hypothetical protein L916_00627 [Phytophthora nicotianae]ETO85698.1 hypothetical protein F444_00667 [Phytophthora nicotianae P1976]ETP26731.1 hypothetical protein F441_00663 [Phytophthora nicotianae CJ01A1]ETP54722.1 hypothetical protein F442_00635 [Phytophthora nicotianae P10297]KUG01665.1 hypothetical protein AM587_10005723 [Phytophthora n
MNQASDDMARECIATQHETKGQPIEMNFEAHDPSPTSTPSDHDNDPNKQTANANMNPNRETSNQDEHQQQFDDTNTDDNQVNHGAYSSYSFTKSSILDDEGHRVASMQGRYEDSAGRLKAVNERQIDSKKLRTTWNSLDPEDTIQPETTCTSGTPEEFEAQWQKTPFGEAQKIIQDQQHQQQLEHSG